MHPAVALDFEWSVSDTGYRWVDGRLEEVDTVAALESFEGGDDLSTSGLPRRYADESVRVLVRNKPQTRPEQGFIDRAYKTYKPLKECTGLFREFVKTAPTEGGILTFVNRFGFLNAASECYLVGDEVLLGESVALWRTKIHEMRAVLEFWRFLRREPEATVRRTKPLELLTDDPLLRHLLSAPVPKGRGSIPQEMRRRAALSLSIKANHILHNTTRVGLSWDTGQNSGVITITPSSLLGAMWLQLVSTLSEAVDFAPCEACGQWFEISRGPMAGKRQGARFCRDACRVAAFRKRRREAGNPSHHGAPARDSAREAGTSRENERGRRRQEQLARSRRKR